MSKIGLLVVDMQNDFLGTSAQIPGSVTEAFKEEYQVPLPHSSADVTIPYRTGRKAALPVLGGVRAADWTTHFIKKYGDRMSDIFFTEDWHPLLHCGHGYPWRGRDGKMPTPFTVITAEGYKNGDWSADGSDEEFKTDMYQYLPANERLGNMHVIWPAHCVQGTWGQLVYEPLIQAAHAWGLSKKKSPKHFRKGSARNREQYGVIQADVPDRRDPTTMPNYELLDEFRSCEKLIIAGLALDYCVKRSIEQILMHLGNDFAKKIMILTDCTAAIDTEAGQKFLDKMRALGARVTTSQEVFA